MNIGALKYGQYGKPFETTCFFISLQIDALTNTYQGDIGLELYTYQDTPEEAGRESLDFDAREN